MSVLICIVSPSHLKFTSADYLIGSVYLRVASPQSVAECSRGNIQLSLMLTASFAGGVVNVNGRKLCPRIILMTDGKPKEDEGRETAGVSRK